MSSYTQLAPSNGTLISDALLEESRLRRPDREVVGSRQQPVRGHVCPLLHYLLPHHLPYASHHILYATL